MTAFPRLLFVTGSAFNNITGGGITFSNLFRGWPQDSLFTVHNDPVPVSFDVCSNYYRLGAGEISRWPRLASRPSGHPEHAASPVVPVAQAAPARPVFHAIRNALVGTPWPDSARLTPELEAWIAQSRPQLIYTILGTVGMTDLVRQIRDRFGIPVAVHFMDDYAASFYKGGVFSPLARRHMNALLKDVVGKAQLRLAIGEAMAQAYGKRWKALFTPIQNAVDVSGAPVADPVRDLGALMRLAYIGSIFPYAQSESLGDIADSVARLAASGQRITLDIYSPLHLAEPYRSRLEIHPAIRLHDTIRNDDAFFRTLTEMDALVLPVNFDRATIAYIRYSMPTKVPAYLVSGTPILAYGPSETAQIAYAEREGWGLVVNRRNPQALDSAIVALQTDNTQRQRLSARARSLAANHDIRHVRRQFQDLLIHAGRPS
jgi:glycosyltransferase involved in cell wall biosynthesis